MAQDHRGPGSPWPLPESSDVTGGRCLSRQCPLPPCSSVLLQTAAWPGAAVALRALLGGRTAWAEGHHSQSAVLKPPMLTDGRAFSWCTCRGQTEPAGATSVLVTLSSGSCQRPSPPDPSVGTSTLLPHVQYVCAHARARTRRRHVLSHRHVMDSCTGAHVTGAPEPRLRVSTLPPFLCSLSQSSSGALGK